MKRPGAATQGFTLIELSIVLVIIGLLVGGVLAGQSLIAAAGVRATISQIEKYNTAVNTFRDKYSALPGDLNASVAAQFGFAARGSIAGAGDGNGVIEGNDGNAGTNYGSLQCFGETGLFWVDLSSVGLIDGGFNTAVAVETSVQVTATSTPSIDAYMPQAKLGGGNYIYVWSGGIAINTNGASANNGLNYFGISAVTLSNGGWVTSHPGLSVAQANGIDTKIDDGYALTGNVQANYIYDNPVWAGQSYPWPTMGDSTTCYDNRGAVAGTPMSYSVEINNGANVNCALSFRFQ